MKTVGPGEVFMNHDARGQETAEGSGSTNQQSSALTNLYVNADGLRPFWGLLLYLAILGTPLLLMMLASQLAQPTQTAPHGPAVIELSAGSSTLREWGEFGFILFATWIMSRIEDRNVFDYGLALSPKRYRWILIGAFWGLLFLSLLIAILWGTHHLVISGMLLRPASALGYGLLWALCYLGVGFFEECLFRGYLQFNLTRCFAGLIRRIAPSSRSADGAGFWIAAVLISFGFGLIHEANPGESPIGLLCAGLAGLMFAFSLWRTGSLWWAIGLHAAWDWAQSFLYGVADSGSISNGHLLATHPAGSALMSGGLTGPEGSLFVLPIMLLIATVIALTLPRNTTSSAQQPWASTAPSSACGGTLA